VNLLWCSVAAENWNCLTVFTISLQSQIKRTVQWCNCMWLAHEASLITLQITAVHQKWGNLKAYPPPPPPILWLNRMFTFLLYFSMFTNVIFSFFFLFQLYEEGNRYGVSLHMKFVIHLNLLGKHTHTQSFSDGQIFLVQICTDETLYLQISCHCASDQTLALGKEPLVAIG
jgi:hypothetical protein